MTEQRTEPAPRTAAGRRLFTDNEPMDMYESDGVTWEDVVAIEAEAAEQSVPPRRLVPDDQLGYLHDGQWFPAEQRTAPRTAAQEALDEFDNIRWDDIWQRVNASGEDDLARWSKKYAGYVRSALVRAAEQSVPPLDGLRAELELMESVGWPGTSHEYRRGVRYAISRLSSLVPQPAFDTGLRERLAAIEHEQWEKWSREVAEQGLTPERIERWNRFWVPYEQLDEPTKDFDRKWADKVIAALAALPSAEQPGEEERT